MTQNVASTERVSRQETPSDAGGVAHANVTDAVGFGLAEERLHVQTRQMLTSASAATGDQPDAPAERRWCPDVEPPLTVRGNRQTQSELFDPAIFAAICSPDFSTAVRRLGQFKRMVGAFSLDVEIGQKVTTIAYRCKLRPDVPRLLGLTEMVVQVALARRATRYALRATRYALRATRHAIQPKVVSVQ